MFIDGLLSILQICFLPGLVILGAFNLNAIDRAVLSVPISLIFNYILVYSLVLLGWYTKDALIITIGVEILLLFILYKKYPKHRATLATTIPIAQPDWELPAKIRALFLLLATLASASLLFKIINTIPSNFDNYDDICNWNRWAVDWYNGVLPFRTWEYPQGLTTNWSISYKLMGTYELEYFVTFINGLIAFYILIFFWGMYLDSRRDVFLVAIPIAAMWINFILGKFLGIGMADVPMALFGVAILYVAHLATASKLSIRQFIILGALIVAGAVVTKQAGNYLVIFYLGVSIFLLRKSTLSRIESTKLIMLGMSIILLLGWSWYIYHKIQSIRGLDGSNIYYLTEIIHEGKSYWERLIVANIDIQTSIKTLDFMWPNQVVFWTGILITVVLIFFSLRSALGALTSIIVTIPFYFIWAIFFSYGHNQRNSALILGFLTISMACGLTYLCANTLPALQRKYPALFKSVGLGLVIVLVFFGLYRLNTKITPESMLHSKIDYLIKSDNSMVFPINSYRTMYRTVYSLYNKQYFSGKVLSNFLCDRANVFPGTNELVTTLIPDDDFAGLKRLLFSGKYSYYLLFLEKYTAPFYKTGFDQLVREGRVTKEIEGGDVEGKFFLYKVNPQD